MPVFSVMTAALLAQGQAPTERSLFGWWLGLIIAFAVIVVVVVVVASILTLAARISGQAQAALQGLDVARSNTLPLWDVEKTNSAATQILTAAQAARGRLEQQRAS